MFPLGIHPRSAVLRWLPCIIAHVSRKGQGSIGQIKHRLVDSILDDVDSDDVKISANTCYEGVQYNVVSVTRSRGWSVQFPKKVVIIWVVHIWVANRCTT